MKALLFFFVLPAFAGQPVSITSKDLLMLNDVSFSGQPIDSDAFSIDMKVSCFGTNLRAVSNPLVLSSNVKTTLVLAKKDGSTGQVNFQWKAVAVRDGVQPAESVAVTVSPPGFLGSAVGAAQGNSIVLAFGQSAGIQSLKKATFEQIPVPPQAGSKPLVIGKEGPLKANLTYNFSASGRTLYIAASFPGAIGSCDGAFYSPLMVFFSSKRPQLGAKVEFPLHPHEKKFYWPEGSPDWAFLVLDRNGNGKIDSGEEMFGESNRFKNGFEALKEFDMNKDGKIDKKDAVFSKLRLWFDRNANGKTDSGELVPLEEKTIVEIDLKYSKSKESYLGKRGELREHSTVKLASGQADIVDVWLGSVKEKGEK